VLLAAGIALRVWHLPVMVYTPDEDAYVNFYAVPLLQQGLGHLPALVKDYNARPELHAFPSPTRAGQLWPMVATMLILSDDSPRAAAVLSAVASVAILVAIWMIGAWFFPPWVAVMALLFAIVSPMDLAMARRAWGDEPFAFLALAAAGTFMLHARAPRRSGWAIACLALAGYSILCKESGLLVLGLVTVGLTIVAWRTSGTRGALLALGAGALTLLVSCAVLALAVGGWEPLVQALHRLSDTSNINAYMREYQSGGPDYYVRGLGLLQPVPMALGMLAALWIALRTASRRGRADVASIGATTLAGLTLAFVAVAFVYPQKNLRFLSPVYAPLDLLAARLVWTALAWVRLRRPAMARGAVVALALILLGSALADHRRFERDFIERQIPDLATPWFTR
jgi:4-amino-4-deoxy-L-arabinose transferase-like glycosyltransferase